MQKFVIFAFVQDSTSLRIMRLYILAVGLIINTALSAQSEKLTDSERLIRLETLMLERFKVIDRRLDELDKKIDANKVELERKIDTNKADFDQKLDRVWSMIFWLDGLLLTAMFGLMGFILWDRRTYLSAVKEQQRLITTRQGFLERQQRLNTIVIDKLIEEDPRLKEIVAEASSNLDQ